MKLDLIFHWKLIDVTECPNGGLEISVLFLKCLFMKERFSYYIDSIGLGLDILSTNKYTAVSIKLIALSLHVQIKKKERLKLIK